MCCYNYRGTINFVQLSIVRVYYLPIYYIYIYIICSAVLGPLRTWGICCHIYYKYLYLSATILNVPRIDCTPSFRLYSTYTGEWREGRKDLKKLKIKCYAMKGTVFVSRAEEICSLMATILIPGPAYLPLHDMKLTDYPQIIHHSIAVQLLNRSIYWNANSGILIGKSKRATIMLKDS